MVLRLLRARRLDRRVDPHRALPEPRRRAGTTPCVCGPGRPTVAVVDQEVPLPAAPSLEIRSHGLWAEHIGTHPLERWQLANEASGVAVDDPAELYRPGGARGDLVPMGLDLEWETDGEPYHYAWTTRYEVPCIVHGEILLGDERIELDGYGQRDHSWAPRDWWQFGWVWTVGPARRRHPVPRLRHPRARRQRSASATCSRPAAGWCRRRGPIPATARCTPRRSSVPRACPSPASVSIAGLDLTIEPHRLGAGAARRPRRPGRPLPAGDVPLHRRRRPLRLRLDGVEPAR